RGQAVSRRVRAPRHPGISVQRRSRPRARRRLQDRARILRALRGAKAPNVGHRPPVRRSRRPAGASLPRKGVTMSQAPMPLSADELTRMHAYFCAANYLSVGQIYLRENPLLREPLRREHIKARLLGHWGTTPGLNLIYVHMNRAIKARDID